MKLIRLRLVLTGLAPPSTFFVQVVAPDEDAACDITINFLDDDGPIPYFVAAPEALMSGEHRVGVHGTVAALEFFAPYLRDIFAAIIINGVEISRAGSDGITIDDLFVYRQRATEGQCET